ncbi:MAG: CoA-binding protein [Desulfitobacteriia bacterium]|jgi:predicted CoA-binding protein
MDQAFLLEQKVWAVVGATQDPEKYGNKIYRKLKSTGYKVYPINPSYKDIDGDPCYKNLSSLPEIPQVINMVVAPHRGEKIINEAAQLGIKYAWFQPGSIDDELLELTKKLGIQSVQACVLVAKS